MPRGLINIDARGLVAASARNNGQWCDAVCRSHGLSTRVTTDAWYCDDAAPLLYPRLVSFTRDDEMLRRLIATHRQSGTGVWGAKDSFGVLADDDPHRRALISAFWYARPASQPPKPGARSVAVGSVVELDQWIDAWGEAPPGFTMFPPSLLAEPGASFLHDGAFRAGLVAFRGDQDELIGVSNFFGEPVLRNECVAGLIARNPGCTIVGYGSRADVESLMSLGFSPVAPLTVWLVDNETTE